VTSYVVNLVQQRLPNAKPATTHAINDPLVEWFIAVLDPIKGNFIKLVTICSITILLLALARGLLMFLMRQTIIVMSRHIEYDQKNEVFAHYQLLDTNFYKTHSTGDMMNRITEDVSRIRSYTGPAIMYLINLLSLIAFCVVNMVRKDPMLTLYVLAPLPILAATIYIVNQIIYKKSEKIQSLLSDLTTNAQ
jgi:ATP-binding cassette subfamily B protein